MAANRRFHAGSSDCGSERFSKPFTSALTSCIVGALLLLTSSTAVGQNRKGYFPEDWVSYTKTRFVTSVALGWSDVYFGTLGGITRYDGFERKWKDPITTSDGLATNQILQLAVSEGDEVIWVQTPVGIYSYNPLFQDWSYENEFPSHLAHSDLERYKDLRSFLLEPGYLFSDQMGRPYVVAPHFRDYRIEDAVEDQWSHLWVATYGLGAIDIDLRSGYANLLNYGLFYENTNAICIDNDTIWFGGESVSGYENAITLWDRRNDTWGYHEALYNDWISSDNVYDIVADEWNVFFGTDYGVVRYDKIDGRFHSYTPGLGLRSSEIHSLLLEDSLLFMGGEGTVDVLLIPKDSVFSIRPPLVPSSTVYHMSHIGSNVWMCTEHGLFRFNEKTLGWSRFDVPNGDLGSQVWQSVEGNSGEVWFAGMYGVYHLDSNLKVIESFQSAHDLRNKTPHRIALTETLLWIGTDNGVLRYDRVNKLWVEYYTDQGLIDNYINDMKLEGDHIWFATPEGVTRFYWNNPKRARDW